MNKRGAGSRTRRRLGKQTYTKSRRSLRILPARGTKGDVDLRYRRRNPRALEARGSIASDLSLALFYSAAKCARQVSPNSVSSSRVSPTKLTTRDTLKVWRGDARGRREEEAHSGVKFSVLLSGGAIPNK